MAAIALSALLVLTLVAQALRPSLRLMIVGGGAAVACFVATVLGVTTTRALFAAIPWDVLLILVTLGLFTEMLVETRVFGVLALASSRGSRAGLRRIILLFTISMYAVSGLVNNLTAILLVLPILLILLKLLGAEQRYVSWTLGLVLVACNLGGAATPIGDFPAILLLGRGSMTFSGYLAAAAPPTAVALAILLVAAVLLVRPDRGVARDPFSTRLTLAVMSALYRNVRLDLRLLLPSLAVLAAMLVAWIVVPASSGVGPDLIAWAGAGAVLLLRPKTGEGLLRRRVDVEAVLFLLSLFLMVAAVSKTGAFAAVTRGLQGLPVGPLGQLIVFLVFAGVLTGLFSAGPSMAALLEVAESLARSLPPTAVYVGLALSVCAGSSLFLTAATSGPTTQILTERAQLRGVDGEPIRFGFFEFLPVGLLSFAIIQAVAIGYALITVAVTR
jgi:Na+/H+ antiporter NhaD/arsenite permease-like protein